MTDLAEFLLARIAEDEETARVVRPEEYLTTRDRSNLRPGSAEGYAHVVATSGRVLAECEAKRRIIQRLTELAQAEGDDTYGDASVALTDTLRLLALPYADHPGYREEWRP